MQQPDDMMKSTKIAIFKGKKIRKNLHNGEWWFSVVDVCYALTGSVDAGAYWRKLKQRLTEEGSEIVTICHGLKLVASDGKKYETDCADTEGVFRICYWSIKKMYKFDIIIHNNYTNIRQIKIIKCISCE